MSLLSFRNNSISDISELYYSDSSDDNNIISRKRYNSCVEEKVSSKKRLIEDYSNIYLERIYNIYSLNHEILENINTNNNLNIGILCCIKDDRQIILIQNITSCILMGGYLAYKKISIKIKMNPLYSKENKGKNKDL